MANMKIFSTFTENMLMVLQKLFSQISPKPFSQGFLWIFKFSENFPKAHQEFPKK